MKTPSGQPKSGALRGVSRNSKSASGSSATPEQSMRGWRVGVSRNRSLPGRPSNPTQTVRAWPRIRSINKKGRA